MSVTLYVVVIEMVDGRRFYMGPRGSERESQYADKYTTKKQAQNVADDVKKSSWNIRNTWVSAV